MQDNGAARRSTTIARRMAADLHAGRPRLTWQEHEEVVRWEEAGVEAVERCPEPMSIDDAVANPEAFAAQLEQLRAAVTIPAQAREFERELRQDSLARRIIGRAPVRAIRGLAVRRVRGACVNGNRRPGARRVRTASASSPPGGDDPGGDPDGPGERPRHLRLLGAPFARTGGVIV